MTEDELRAELTRLAAERKAAFLRGDVDRVLELRAEIGRITAEIHRLRREQKQEARA